MATITIDRSINVDDAFAMSGGICFVALAAGSTTYQTNATGIATWVTATNSATTNWQSVCYGNNIVVAVSSTSGTIAATSPAGATGTWTTRTLPITATWYAVAFGANIFVATTSGLGSATNAAAYSSDGVVWTSANMPVSGNWRTLVYGDGRFVSLSYGGTATAYSTNGTTWSAGGALPATRNWTSLAYGENTYVAIAPGTDRGAYSTDNGATWQEMTMPSSSNWNSVTYGNGTFVAVSNTSGTIAAYSADGITWFPATLPTTAVWTAVAFGNNLFTALANTSTAASYSYDGINWVAITALSQNVTCMCYTPTTWNSGDTLTITNNSTVTVNTTQSKFWSAVTLTNGKLVINNTSTSTGIRFTMGRTSGASANAITPGSGIGDIEINGNWIELGTGSGASGQTMTAPFSDYIPCLWVETASGSGVYEVWLNATGSYGDTTPILLEGLSAVSSGARGKFFIQQATASPYGPFTLTATLGSYAQRLVTVSSTTGLYPGAQILGPSITANTVVNRVISSTQIELSNITSAEMSPDWRSIAFGNSTYVAIATTRSDQAMTSTDGVTWTARTLPFPADWMSVCYGSTTGIFCAVASDSTNGVGYCATSPDGITWTQRALPSIQNWMSVASNGTSYVAVGQTSANAATTAGAYSADGVTWSATIMASQVWNAVAYGGSRYLAVGTGTATSYSATGSGTWTAGALLSVSATYMALAYNGSSLWVVVSGSSTGSQSKADPTTGTFTAGGALPNSTSRGIAWDGTNFVVVSTTNSNRSSRSTNATSWTNTTLTGTQIGSWNAVVANGTTLVAVSSSGLLRSYAMTSTNSGATWTVQTGTVTNTTLRYFNPYVAQLTDSVQFGDGINGNKVPTGAKVRCPNIMFTSDTPANLHTSSRVLGANMVMTNGGALSANICLFDESYNTFTQAETINLTYCGFSLPPVLTECYGVNLNSIGFGLEPVRRYYQFSATLASNGWFSRDTRYASASNSWNYINDAVINDLNCVVGMPYALGGTGGGSITSPNAAIYITYTQGAILTNLRFYGLNVTRQTQAALNCNTLFNNNTITNLESYGLGPIFLGVSTGNTISNIVFSEDMFNATKSHATANRLGIDPIAGTKLANNTKYYLKQRTFKDWSNRAVYSESRVVSATPYLGDTYHPQSFSAYNSGPRTNTLTWVRRDPTAATIAYTIFRSTSAGFTRDPSTRLYYTATSTTVTYANTFVIQATGAAGRTLTFNKAGRTITASTGSFITDGFVAGANVVVSGTTSNNGTYMISSLTATVITLTSNHTNLTNEGPISTGALNGQPPSDGTTYYYRLLKCDSQYVFTNNTSGTISGTTLTTSGNFNTGAGTILNCEGVSGSNKIRIPVGSTTNFLAGNVNIGTKLSGGGVGSGAYVVSIDTPWQVTVSVVNSSTFTGTTLNMGVNSGMYVYGPGIAWPTKIVSIDSNTSLTVDTPFIDTFTNTSSTIMYGNESSEVEVYTLGATTPAFNFLTQTDDFSNVAWTKTNMTVSTAQRLAPSQLPFSTAALTGTANRLLSTGPLSKAVQTVTDLKIGNQYTYSVYHMTDPNFYFQTVSGELSVNTTVTTTQSFTATGVWQRASTTFTATATSHTFTVQINTDGAYLFVVSANLTPGSSLLAPIINTTKKLATASGGRTFTFASSSTVNTITASSGSFTTDGFVAGDAIIVSGTTSNDGTYVLAVVAATILTIHIAQPFVAEGPISTGTITGSVLAAAAQELTLAAAWSKSLGGNDDNQGIETTLAALPASAHFSEFYLGTASNFTPTDLNRVAYASLFGSHGIASLSNSEGNRISNITQIGNAGFSGTAVYLTGSSNNNFQDFTLNINYAAATILNVSALANDNVLDDFTIQNFRNNVTTVTPFVFANNASGVRLQNISFNHYDIPYYTAATTSALGVVMKGVTGGHSEPASAATTYALGSTLDGVGVSFTTVYDTIFHEFYYSPTTGALQLRFNASSSETPPYTIVAGTPTFSNTGLLYLRNAGDSIEFTWPHRIFTVSGFRDILPKFSSLDLGHTSSLDAAFSILLEYAIDTGSGYGAFKRATPTNLAAESVSTTTGFYFKVRLTARPGMMFSTQTNAFVVGEQIEGAISGATATVDELYQLTTTTGTIIISSITGTFLPGELIRRASDNQSRATNVVTNSQFALFPSFNSYVNGLEIFTNSVGPGDYAGTTVSITLTNVVSGSTYYVFKTSDGTFLGSGTASSSTVTIPGITYVADFGVTIRVRKSSSAPKYIPLETQAIVNSAGASVYIGQTADSIAT